MHIIKIYVYTRPDGTLLGQNGPGGGKLVGGNAVPILHKKEKKCILTL